MAKFLCGFATCNFLVAIINSLSTPNRAISLFVIIAGLAVISVISVRLILRK
jgi:hypothetical protein